MHPNVENHDPLVFSTPEPQLNEIIADFERATPIYNNWNRLYTNEEIRFTRWPGQSSDGRKHDVNMPDGQEAFPWDGASDSRVPLADEIIDGFVAAEFVAFWRALLQVQGVEAGDIGASAAASKLLQWLIGTRQFKQLVQEVELHSQYTHTYGWSVLYVSWERERLIKLNRVNMDELIQLASAGDAPPEVQILPRLILDPTQETSVVNLIAGLLPQISAKRARKAVRDLRRDGVADIPVPYLCKDEPVIMALKPWEEVLIPNYCTDIQQARVFVRQWFREAELRAKAQTDGWDPAWVEQVVKHKGKFSAWVLSGKRPETTVSDWQFEIYDTKLDLIEVVWCYQKQLDEENIPGIYLTVFNSSIAKDPNDRDRPLYGFHALLDYKHGRMPFIVRKRENWARTIVSSRGVPEIVNTWQRSVKVQEDAITDQTSLGVLPPILTPNLAGVDYKFRPAGQVPVVLNSQRPEFMNVPAIGTRIAFELWDRIERRTDRYFGRRRLDEAPDMAQAKLQRAIQSNLISWTEAFQQEFQLVQQFMSPDKIERITGTPTPFSPDIASINQQFDFLLTFDVRELDTDFMQAKLKAIKDIVLPVDVMGRIDKGKLVEMLLRAIDPTLAKELIVGQESASQATYRRVQTDVAMMLLGFEPEYSEMDPTAGARLQFLREIVSGNPKALAMMQEDPRFRELLQKYEQNLAHSVAQEQNKLVGRIGVTPAAAKI